MTTIFLSGSRSLSRFDKQVMHRLDNIVNSEFSIITGDANGADKAMQKYLAELSYRNVTIYFVGNAPRNNVGAWPEKKVEVPNSLKGRDFFAQKDKAMSKISEFGVVLWDGESPGSIQNIIWLIEAKKKVVMFYAPEKRFINLKTIDDFIEFIASVSKDTINKLREKIKFPMEFDDIFQIQGKLL